MNLADKEYKPSINETDKARVNLHDVRKLELRYSRRAPGEESLFVVCVRGRIRVFEVDTFWIERLLEQLEDRGR